MKLFSRALPFYIPTSCAWDSVTPHHRWYQTLSPFRFQSFRPCARVHHYSFNWNFSENGFWESSWAYWSIIRYHAQNYDPFKETPFLFHFWSLCWLLVSLLTVAQTPQYFTVHMTVYGLKLWLFLFYWRLRGFAVVVVPYFFSLYCFWYVFKALNPDAF